MLHRTWLSDRLPASPVAVALLLPAVLTTLNSPLLSGTSYADASV